MNVRDRQRMPPLAGEAPQALCMFLVWDILGILMQEQQYMGQKANLCPSFYVLL